MNTLTKRMLKRLLYAYLVALFLVALFFIAKLIIDEQTIIEYKSFKKPSEKVIMESDESKEEGTRFMLLPRR